MFEKAFSFIELTHLLVFSKEEKHSLKEKMTEEIILLAVQNDGYSLLYVPKEKMTKQIIEIAVQTAP